jgi:hypothetical protein
MPTQPWQEAFLAMSAVLGETLEASLGALPGDPALHAPDLQRALRASSREERAHAMARALAEVVVGLEQMRLR